MNWRRLRRRVHPVWQVAWASSGIILGIALAVTVKTSLFYGYAILFVALGFLVVSLTHRRRYILPLALLAGLLVGLWRGGIEQRALLAYKPYYGKTVTLSGVVSDDAAYNAQGNQQLRLAGIQIADQKLGSSVWLSTSTGLTIKRSDHVRIRGTLQKGFGNIPAALYDAQILSVERPVPGDVPLRIRDWFAGGVKRAIPEPEGSLSVGYLVGQKSALPEVLSQQLKVVGLTHVVVASGYNLTILVGFARRLFAKHSKYLSALSAGLMIGGFMLLTGLSPSMSRAGLVSLLSLIAWYYGRSVHPVVLLVFSAAITVLWRPAYVWGDIGWYLSFLAFTGVILLGPLLRRYFFGRQKVGLVRATLLETTSAQLLTLPVMLHTFGQYASYALIANILVLPLVPLAMLLTFVAGMGGLAIPQLARWFGWPARLVLLCNVWVINRIAHWPGASGDIGFGLPALIGSYVAIGALIVYMWRVTGYNFRNPEQDERLTIF